MFPYWRLLPDIDLFLVLHRGALLDHESSTFIVSWQTFSYLGHFKKNASLFQTAELYLLSVKRILAISLACLILLQLAMKMYVFTTFQLNKSYIAATLCENKALPKKQCNGKCYLAKKMQKEEQQPQSLPSLLKGMEEIFLTSSPCFISVEHATIAEETSVFSPYLVKSYSSEPISVFQPPRV